MGKAGTKTRDVIWPSYEAAVAWAKRGYPPYLEPKDIPKGYGFWGEVVTILKRGAGGRIDHYRARAYFLPLAELERLEGQRRNPSTPATPELADAPLKWMDYEPRETFRVPGKGGFTRSVGLHPAEVWRFSFMPAGERTDWGLLDVDVPERRRLDPNEIKARRKAFRRALASRAAVVRETRAEEVKATLAARDDTSLAAARQSLGLGDEKTGDLPMTQKQAEERFMRAEKLVDKAFTEDDIKKALNMVAVNQLYGRSPSADPRISAKRNESFLRKTADQTLKFIDEAIEVLHARKKELPFSPVEEWRADISRLVSLYEEYNRLTNQRLKRAEDNIRRWRGWVGVLETMGSPAARLKRSIREGGRPSYRPDPGIGSEERGLPPGARSTPAKAGAQE